MGVSWIHGDRSTGGKRRLPPLDPAMGVCAECGAKRDVVTTPVGSIYKALAGTWWHVHPGGATCSVMCRVMGGYPPGPFDSE